jgi:hypothetical protein
MPPPLHRHGDPSDHDSESRDGPQTDTSVRLGVASTMKHALAGASIEAQTRNSFIRVMPIASGPTEVCGVRFEHRSPLELEPQTPKSPISNFPPTPIWPGNGEGIPVSRFGRNPEGNRGGRRRPGPAGGTGNPRFPMRPRTGIGVPGAAGRGFRGLS